MTSLLDWIRRGRFDGTEASERGSSLLGILSVVGTLGILAVIVLTLNLGSSPAPVGTTVPGSPTTTTAPQSVASGQQAADRVACQTDFAAITTAVTDYRTLNGAGPPAGTAWATSNNSGGPYIQSWPSLAPAFTFTWNGTELSVLPAEGRAAHGTPGTSSPPTGCFAH